MRSQTNARGTWAGVFAAALVAILASGCEVVNPGPVADEYIALPASQAGLVAGSWERMTRLVGNDAYNQAMAAREIFHGGQTGSYGHGAAQQAGYMGSNQGDWASSGNYNLAQQARWVAEEAIRQFEARGDVAADIMTSAYLAAGYANRYNGDYFCWGVIDGGPLVPGKHYWELAEGHFTNAIATAPGNDTRHAAYAGRAQARLQLGNYQGAIDDAKQVPDDFVLYVEMDFSKSGNTGQRNHVYWAQADNPFRSWTTYHTFYHGYYEETGDPRVPWAPFANPAARLCLGGLQGYANSINGSNGVECFQQKKYLTQDDDIRAASGAEMRLIEAEAMLRLNPGNWQQAMALINANRSRYISEKTQQPLSPWVANNLDDAWTFLMRERGIELWLEARRASDMRRWEPLIREYGTFTADGQTVLPLPATTPGTLDWPNFEGAMISPTSNLFTTTVRGRAAIRDQERPRELCYNISNTERQNNPNFNELDAEP
jgi:hypothetical protein